MCFFFNRQNKLYVCIIVQQITFNKPRWRSLRQKPSVKWFIVCVFLSQHFLGKHKRTLLNSTNFMMCGWQILCMFVHFPFFRSNSCWLNKSKNCVNVPQSSVLRWAIRSHPLQAEIVDVRKGNRILGGSLTASD